MKIMLDIRSHGDDCEVLSKFQKLEKKFYNVYYADITHEQYVMLNLSSFYNRLTHVNDKNLSSVFSDILKRNNIDYILHVDNDNVALSSVWSEFYELIYGD